MKVLQQISPVTQISPDFPIPGLTADERTIVSQALAILERHLRQPGDAFLSMAEAGQWLRLRMASLERETLVVLLLDNQNRLLEWETLFTGTLNHTAVYPREIVKLALAQNAAAVIIAHNHPSGAPEPGKADRMITKRVADALDLVEIRLLDHFVVGHKDVVSFAERGWL